MKKDTVDQTIVIPIYGIWRKHLQRRGYPVKTVASTLNEAYGLPSKRKCRCGLLYLTCRTVPAWTFWTRCGSQIRSCLFILVSCHDKDDYEQGRSCRGATLCMDK